MKRFILSFVVGLMLMGFSALHKKTKKAEIYAVQGFQLSYFYRILSDMFSSEDRHRSFP